MKKYFLLITGLLLAVTGLRAQTCTSTCPESISVHHNINAPFVLDCFYPYGDDGVTHTYKLVETNLTGTNQCWLAQNLYSTAQATSATDLTDAAAGWYWRFNRKQAYNQRPGDSYSGETYYSSYNTDWLPANDPCILLLGSNWRLPTSTEWTNANANGAWGGYADAFNSDLKLHAAGGAMSGWVEPHYRGTYGYYLSSTHSPSNNGYYILQISSSSSKVVELLGNSAAYSVRCLMDL